MMAKNFKAWPENWPKTQYYPDIPVFAFLDQTASRVPNRIAMVFGGMELTYSEFKDLSDRFAAALLEQGVKKGDRVAIHLPNMPQFAIAYYGAIRIGAIYTPVSPLLSPQEARHQLEDAGAETLVSLDLLYPGVAPIIPETPVRRVITTSIADCYNAVIAAVKPLEKVEVPDTLDMAALLKEHEPFEGSVPLEPSKDLVHLAYTGGTTGVSKGVMLTHANVVANVIQYGNWLTGARVEMVDGMLQAHGQGPGDGSRGGPVVPRHGHGGVFEQPGLFGYHHDRLSALRPEGVPGCCAQVQRHGPGWCPPALHPFGEPPGLCVL